MRLRLFRIESQRLLEQTLRLELVLRAGAGGELEPSLQIGRGAQLDSLARRGGGGERA
jgi:hypothetical protein